MKRVLVLTSTLVTWTVNLHIIANKWVGIYSLTYPIVRITQDSRVYCALPMLSYRHNEIELELVSTGWLVGRTKLLMAWHGCRADDFNWCWSLLLRLTDRWETLRHGCVRITSIRRVDCRWDRRKMRYAEQVGTLCKRNESIGTTDYRYVSAIRLCDDNDN